MGSNTRILLRIYKIYLKPSHCWVNLQKCHFWVFVSQGMHAMVVSGRRQLDEGEQAGSWDGSPGAQRPGWLGARPQPSDGQRDRGGWNPPWWALVQVAWGCRSFLFSGKASYLLSFNRRKKELEYLYNNQRAFGRYALHIIQVQNYDPTYYLLSLGRF